MGAPHGSHYTVFSSFLRNLESCACLKFFCFGAVSIFRICYGTYQSVDEGISETINMKKILATSYGKVLNLVYQN